MTNSLHVRILNIFLDNILTKINYIIIIFFISSLVYNYEINAIDEINVDDLQNSSLEKFTQNNNSRIVNYPHSNIINLTNKKSGA